jgi:endonuclease YncB( thermonuclease family)
MKIRPKPEANRIIQAVLILTYLFLISCNQQLVSGKVISIADGDTFTMLVQEQQLKVRLHGIDAPEKGQDFSNVSKEFLSDLVFDKVVDVQVLDLDRYGRTLGIVNVDNKIVNEEMLKAGLAWHYKDYDTNPAWARLEEEAQRNRRGLWAHPNPQPPWEWRKSKRKKSEKDAIF